jgi:ureidoacrylate peracid hydrolase
VISGLRGSSIIKFGKERGSMRDMLLLLISSLVPLGVIGRRIETEGVEPVRPLSEPHPPKLINLDAEPESIKVDLKRTAVIVVDMQNAFCTKGGMFDLIGLRDESILFPTIEVNKKVIEAARSAGIKVIYLRMGFRPDFSDDGGPKSPNPRKGSGAGPINENPAWKDKLLVRGTWGWEIFDPLKPREGDIIVDKNRYSGFFNTELDSILRTCDVKYLVFVGIATNVCVESTVRDAFHFEYCPIVISDGCARGGPPFVQEAMLFNVKAHFGWVTTSSEFVKTLEQMK